MTGNVGIDQYALLDVLVEGAVPALIGRISAEQQMAATLIELLMERLKAHRLAWQRGIRRAAHRPSVRQTVTSELEGAAPVARIPDRAGWPNCRRPAGRWASPPGRSGGGSERCAAALGLVWRGSPA